MCCRLEPCRFGSQSGELNDASHRVPHVVVEQLDVPRALGLIGENQQPLGNVLQLPNGAVPRLTIDRRDAVDGIADGEVGNAHPMDKKSDRSLVAAAGSVEAVGSQTTAPQLPLPGLDVAAGLLRARSRRFCRGSSCGRFLQRVK